MSYAYELKNDYLTATVVTKGAELVSLKDAEGTEYIWNADEKYWKRHTPLLFPIVGKILDGKYSYGGADYSLPAHGFARDLEFEAEKNTSDSVIFTLRSSLGTKAMYPFDFCLKVIYTLKDKALDIAYEVTNEDQQTMFFKLGAHPGFMCPLQQGEHFEDYYLEFEKEEQITELLVTPDVFLSDKTRTFSSKQIALTKKLFEQGPLVFTDYNSESMSLCSKKHQKGLTVTFKGFPFLGIWSTTDEAPFVCIEPWYGHADYSDDHKEINNKKDVISLGAKETFKCVHTVSVL